VPAGEWTVIRYGMASTGKRNQYASAGFRAGLCYDPLNRSGVTAQWKEVASRSLASRVLVRDGALEVLDKGRYEVTTGDGRTLAIEQPAAVPPLAIQGPWKIEFPEKPQLGEPFRATYEHLGKSWKGSRKP
jgi:hypothetical protein